MTLGSIVGLEHLNLASIASIGGKLELRANPSTTVSLPALEQVGEFLVAENSALESLNVSVLTSVGGDLTIVDNPVLPTCEAQELAQRLGVAIVGRTMITGNNDTAVCAR